MRRFIKDESGVITIEWVVMGASLLLIALAIVVIVGSGFRSGAETIDTGISNTEMPGEMRALLDAAHGS